MTGSHVANQIIFIFIWCNVRIILFHPEPRRGRFSYNSFGNFIFFWFRHLRAGNLYTIIISQMRRFISSFVIFFIICCGNK